MSDPGGVKLVLFFTRGVSLRTWDEVGMFEREVALYRRLQQHGVGISFVTYGDRTEQRYHNNLDGIKLVPLCRTSSQRRNLARLLLKHWPILLGSDVLKTNQIPGSELAVWCKGLLGKKLIVRCGYLPSVFAREQARGAVSIEQALALERTAFQAADAVVVTSERDREYVLETHKVAADRVRVIPNYVVTDVFQPKPEVRKEYDLVCVANPSPQKNINGLLAALALLKAQGREVSLLLLGGCSSDPTIQSTIEAHQLNVALGGNVPNFELPRYLNSARAFVLPSHYEGHPKALLEAMSCELPCIGTDVMGIRELIHHRETGYLCGTSPQEIRTAIQEVLTNADLRARMGCNAREFVVEHFALDRVLEMEFTMLQEVVSRREITCSQSGR